MTTTASARYDAEQRRRELLALAADVLHGPPGEQAAVRAALTAEVLALAHAVTAADLDALSTTQLCEVGALLAAAVGSRPEPASNPEPGRGA